MQNTVSKLSSIRLATFSVLRSLLDQVQLRITVWFRRLKIVLFNSQNQIDILLIFRGDIMDIDDLYHQTQIKLNHLSKKTT